MELDYMSDETKNDGQFREPQNKPRKIEPRKDATSMRSGLGKLKESWEPGVKEVRGLGNQLDVARDMTETVRDHSGEINKTKVTQIIQALEAMGKVTDENSDEAVVLAEMEQNIESYSKEEKVLPEINFGDDNLGMGVSELRRNRNMMLFETSRIVRDLGENVDLSDYEVRSKVVRKVDDHLKTAGSTAMVNDFIDNGYIPEDFIDNSGVYIDQLTKKAKPISDTTIQQDRPPEANSQ